MTGKEGGKSPEGGAPAGLSWRRAGEFFWNVLRLEQSVTSLQRDNERLNAQISALQRQTDEQAGQIRVLLQFIHSALDEEMEAQAERAAIRALERMAALSNRRENRSSGEDEGS